MLFIFWSLFRLELNRSFLRLNDNRESYAGSRISRGRVASKSDQNFPEAENYTSWVCRKPNKIELWSLANVSSCVSLAIVVAIA